jgi:hypothetical protein
MQSVTELKEAKGGDASRPSPVHREAAWQILVPVVLEFQRR